MKFLALLAVLLSIPEPSRADGGCMPTYAFRCPCRPDCDQDYCEKYCHLCGESGTQCRYCCSPYCACGAVGKNASKGFLDLTAGLFAANAAAAEIKTVEGPKEYTNAHGDFLIVPKSKKADPVAGVGVRLVKKGEELWIDEVLKIGAAEKAGIAVGDVVLSIGGKKAKTLGLRDAASALKGKAGSRVKLVVRKANGTTVSKTLVRERLFSGIAVEKASVDFKTVPAAEGECAPKSGDCLYLYRDAEGCHYTCKPEAK